MNFLRALFGGASYHTVNAQTYHDDYMGDKIDHTLIDVRTAREYEAGHLAHARNIPLHELTSRLAEIPTEKPVVLVCASGSRSAVGAGQLVRAGYTQVYNLQGGTFGWMRHKLPLKKG